ncbi:MAG: FAD-dependent oxidoreductase, partial [Cyanobacteria bacterium K_Offshore_surface_m2_239]|nr:FAD-dependent oxidoreductase [Cyanobacteria bacterium K_Offshore_surface_m2_239]
MPGSVLVVGAGLVGQAIAWQLVERGLSVTLVDPTLEGVDAFPPSAEAFA